MVATVEIAQGGGVNGDAANILGAHPHKESPVITVAIANRSTVCTDQ